MKNPNIFRKSTTKDCRYKIEFTKLTSAFRKLFFSQSINLKDWERLEAKKQISRSESPTSSHEKMVH